MKLRLKLNSDDGIQSKKTSEEKKPPYPCDCYTACTGNGRPQISHCSRRLQDDPEPDHSGVPISIDDHHNDHSGGPLRNGQRHAEEGVKGIALLATVGTGQGWPVLSLEEVLDEAVVAPHVVGQGFRRHELIALVLSILERRGLEWKGQKIELINYFIHLRVGRNYLNAWAPFQGSSDKAGVTIWLHGAQGKQY